MSPTIVLNERGRPILTVGAAGGPKIITQVVLTIVRYLDLRQPLPQAVAGPRFHHQWRPDVVSYENDLPEDLIDGLEQRGHELKEIDSGGITQAIGIDNWDKLFDIDDTRARKLIGVSDPRGRGKAAGE
jgi:gamma-glutamyltranspeptidase/glutathione hydrolase